MKNVAVQVVKEVNDCLLKHGYSAMGMEKGNVLQGQIEEVADPNHRVRHLVSEYLAPQNVMNDCCHS